MQKLTKLKIFKILILKYLKFSSLKMGIGDWGLGIGDWGLGPIPNPQSPIPSFIGLYIFNNKIIIK